MAFFVWCELVCSVCSNHDIGQYTIKGVPRKELARDARRAGWSLREDGEWFCRSCTARETARLQRVAATKPQP